VEDRRTGMGLGTSSNETPEISLQLLKENFPDAVLETMIPQGDATAVVRSDALTKIIDFLKNDPRLQFNILIDITAIDYPERKPRFDVVYHLLSLPFSRRLRLKVPVADGQTNLESLTPCWASANWLEREVWDMFGIRFAGHPDLKRILLYEPFEGHPLRKDYPIRKRQPLIGPKI
jgi:NADH-quinone oxidoreductase subunit C